VKRDRKESEGKVKEERKKSEKIQKRQGDEESESKAPLPSLPPHPKYLTSKSPQSDLLCTPLVTGVAVVMLQRHC
jgi:hypothetical protein